MVDFWDILCIVWSITSFIASLYLMFRRGSVLYSLLFYYQMLLYGGMVANSVTWYSCSESIASFYVTIGLLFVVYLVFCAYTIVLHKKSFFLSNKRIFIYISKSIVILTSLVFVFWIIVLLGIFIHDNKVVEMENIYDLIPDYVSLSTFFDWVRGLLKATIRFFEVGIYQLFASNKDEFWMTFLQSARWSYGSIIVITVLNIITNMLGINNMDFDDKSKENSHPKNESVIDIDE